MIPFSKRGWRRGTHPLCCAGAWLVGIEGSRGVSHDWPLLPGQAPFPSGFVSATRATARPLLAMTAAPLVGQKVRHPLEPTIYGKTERFRALSRIAREQKPSSGFEAVSRGQLAAHKSRGEGVAADGSDLIRRVQRASRGNGNLGYTSEKCTQVRGFCRIQRVMGVIPAPVFFARNRVIER